MKNKVVILSITGVLFFLGLYVPANSQLLDLSTKIASDTVVDIEILYTTVYPGTDTIWLEVRMKNPVMVAGYHFTFFLSNPDLARFCQNSSGIWSIDTTGIMILPSPNYNTLFELCLSLCSCIPDSTTNRSTLIFLNDLMSWLEDDEGYVLPFRYHQGEVMVWWSVPGDANGDSLVSAADIVFLINYLFRGEPEPCVCEAADCLDDGVINVGDIIYLVSYLFFNGPAPRPGNVHCSHPDCWH